MPRNLWSCVDGARENPLVDSWFSVQFSWSAPLFLHARSVSPYYGFLSVDFSCYMFRFSFCLFIRFVPMCVCVSVCASAKTNRNKCSNVNWFPSKSSFCCFRFSFSFREYIDKQNNAKNELNGKTLIILTVWAVNACASVLANFELRLFGVFLFLWSKWNLYVHPSYPTNTTSANKNKEKSLFALGTFFSQWHR